MQQSQQWQRCQKIWKIVSGNATFSTVSFCLRTLEASNDNWINQVLQSLIMTFDTNWIWYVCKMQWSICTGCKMRWSGFFDIFILIIWALFVAKLRHIFSRLGHFSLAHFAPIHGLKTSLTIHGPIHISFPRDHWVQLSSDNSNIWHLHRSPRSNAIQST